VRHLVSGTGIIRGFAALCVLQAWWGLALSQTGKSHPEDVVACDKPVVVEAQSCLLRLAPGQTVSVGLSIAAGSLRMISAQQRAGAVELRLGESRNGAFTAGPYSNPAGVSSSVRVLVAAGEQIALSNPSTNKPAVVVLKGDAPQVADARSRSEREAEEAFARAELLRGRDTKDFAAAIKEYDQAIDDWQSAGNELQMARALVWKADFLINNEGQVALAQPAMDRVTPLLPSLDAIEAAHYWLELAFINVVQGKYDVVQDAYKHALALYEQAGDAEHQAKVLDNAARVELLQGRTDTALAEEKRAAELAKQAGDGRRQAFVEEAIGAIDATIGDSESAYQAYGEALQLFKTLPAEPRMQAALWVDFSDLYITLGDLGRAEEMLDQANVIWKSIDYPIGQVDTLNNYGDLFLERNQPRTARDYFERGLTLADSIKYERGSIALLSGMGDSYLEEKDIARAQDVLNRALARAKTADESDETQIECQLGDLAMLQQDYRQAGKRYEACRLAAIKDHDPYSEIRAEGGLARSAFGLGALDEAQTHCEKALAGIEATRGNIRNQDLRTSFFASQHTYYDLDIRILERLDRLRPDEGYQWQAFLIAERARARTLLDQVTSSHAGTRPSASSALLSQYEEVQRRLRRLEARGAGGSGEGGPQSKPRTAASTLTLLEHQLHQEIADSGSANDAASAGPRLSLAGLQEALPPARAALVEYWTGESGSYAWVITRSGFRGLRLAPASKIDSACKAFRSALLAPASTDTHLTAQERAALGLGQEAAREKSAARVSALLFPAGLVPRSTAMIFVVGDGSMESVPLAALRRNTFLNEPSAAIFSLLETSSPAPHPVRLAVFAGDPVAPEGTSRAGSRSTADRQMGGPPQFAPLPFSANEAEMIRSIFGAAAVRLFAGASNTAATLQHLDWSEFSIGHFAMHAVLSDRYAELSGLALGEQRQTGTASNLLWYGDVQHLDAKLELAVLSACNTARGTDVPGEGLRGLTQAFFAAGSQRVLGTLWEVDDEATSEYMRHFYEALKQTRSPVEALRRAQRAMAADPQWNAPYYWSGFVLAGDWRPLA
jgi:CHAT domain-containing protein/Tfp pilus assembly protein PilF